jgi:RNA polymerase sigma-70 factor (ECF subfamily)
MRSGTSISVSTGADDTVRLPATGVGWARRCDVDVFAAQVDELFRRCERRVGKYLAQMVGDRGLAEDLLQDVFHDAFRAREQLRDIRNADAWLFGIARNRALNALRKGRRLQAALARLARRPARSDPDHELLALRDLLERHVAPEDRSLLILRYLHGFDACELGEMTGRSAEAVRQRLARARAKLIAAAAEPLDSSQEE